jgi:hypothetical protein
MSSDDSDRRPDVRVLRGSPDDAEVAALIVALGAVSGPPARDARATVPRAPWLRSPRYQPPGSWTRLGGARVRPAVRR